MIYSISLIVTALIALASLIFGVVQWRKKNEEIDIDIIRKLSEHTKMLVENEICMQEKIIELKNEIRRLHGEIERLKLLQIKFEKLEKENKGKREDKK